MESVMLRSTNRGFGGNESQWVARPKNGVSRPEVATVPILSLEQQDVALGDLQGVTLGVRSHEGGQSRGSGGLEMPD